MTIAKKVVASFSYRVATRQNFLILALLLLSVE